MVNFCVFPSILSIYIFYFLMYEISQNIRQVQKLLYNFFAIMKIDFSLVFLCCCFFSRKVDLCSKWSASADKCNQH